jgi:putative polyhydroxyalkanoate system protein
MPHIKLRRSHKLGLPKARKIAWKWAEKVEKKFGMACTVIEGEEGDTVAFTRSGVSGELQVAADHFEVHARLGFLLGAFSNTIEAEIEKELDALLGQAAARSTAKSAAKGAPAKPKRKAT